MGAFSIIRSVNIIHNSLLNEPYYRERELRTARTPEKTKKKALKIRRFRNSIFVKFYIWTERENENESENENENKTTHMQYYGI